MRSYQTRKGFWREAIALQGSITIHVLPSIISFGFLASGVCCIAWLMQSVFDVSFNLDISPFGFAGAVLGILLVIRLNAGYDRWWEARTLWGGMVNQSRNLVISAMAYGPDDSEWRESLVRWTAAFPHVARHSLRGEPSSTEVANLVGPKYETQVANADHMPGFVAWQLSELLGDAKERLGMDGFAFIQIDRERALLVNHIGACERILATPLPRIYSITIRRFILLFLLILPMALIHLLEVMWFIPFVTMVVAYPLLTLDQIGVELENPFATSSLSNLPLDDISANIERNVFAILSQKQVDKS
ncbi:MAG: bestrophin family protein [Rubinisphaera brasiliensis]|uniref:bestrophin family protein n=1 Tax=Rubinisphaera brasiliensis TaxID=119 RepID=UPI00391B26EE|nr:hypothetical protein [bacterium]